MSFKKVLVLSDVHYGDLAHLNSFGKSTPSTDDELKEVANSVVSTLEGEKIHVDYIFVLGDLTSRGSPGELQDVYRFLTILRDLLLLSEDEVFITYGNHDVDWKICNIDAISSGYIDAYCKAAAQLGGIFAPPGNYTIDGPVLGSGITRLEGIDLISLNSGIECYSSQDVKHGKLGNVQFDWIENELKKHLRENATKIIILHHHLINLPYSIPVYDLSAVEEGANIVDILGKLGVDMVLHGHRHHPIVHTTLRSNWEKPITFFCAGSFGVCASERASGRLPNTMHVVEIESNSGNKNLEGVIQSFELNMASEWIPLGPKKTEYLLNQMQWFGAPDAKNKASEKVIEILTSGVDKVSAGAYFQLPDYESLPICLRCISYDELSKLFQSEASNIGLQVTGEYPSKCIVTGKV